MTEWTLQVSYGLKSYDLKAVLEYHSSQIMRVRVQGLKSTMLLENDYPLLVASKSKKGVQWKIRDGGTSETNPKVARLMLTIFEQLEHFIKKDFPLG